MCSPFYCIKPGAALCGSSGMTHFTLKLCRNRVGLGVVEEWIRWPLPTSDTALNRDIGGVVCVGALHGSAACEQGLPLTQRVRERVLSAGLGIARMHRTRKS